MARNLSGGWARAGLFAACVAVPLIAIFEPTLFRGRQFAFQDAGHYYYPLLERVQQEWDAGRWPLWAQESGAGRPILGDPTAAVLYPGKIVFFLLPHPWAVRAFAIGHVALAFAAMAALLRGWGVSTTGSILGSLAYAFGVPVLSQVSNVIFLVGASWAPLGFLAADRWLRLRRRGAVLALAVVLALQVLGGDPEAAYLTFAAALGYAAGLAAARPPSAVRRLLLTAALAFIPTYLGLLGLSWWSTRAIHQLATSAQGTPAPWAPPSGPLMPLAAWAVYAAVAARRARRRGDARGFARGAAGLIGAAALALAIAGAQLLPILEYTGMSFRAAESEGFHDFYPYSAHPLQLLDALWPNVFGTLEGGYRSWLNELPPKVDSRSWMPSVYLGGLSLVLASASAGFRGGPPGRAWLSVVAVVSLLGALGYYASPLLWARCVPGWSAALGPIEPPFSWQVRDDGYLRDGDGGVYWLLASLLPGFRSFRYPPKLLVFWALAVSGLAGLGWDRLAMGHRRRAMFVGGALLVVSLATLSATWIGAEPLRSWFDRLAATLKSSDEPLGVARAIGDLRAAIARGAAVAALSLAVLTMMRRRPTLAGSVAVAGLAVDLTLANAYHVVTVPQSAFEQTPRALALIREAERANPSAGPFRVQRVGRWWPANWADSRGRDFEAITRWERDSLRPNYPMPLGVRTTFYHDTIEPMDYGLFFLPWMARPDSEALRSDGLRPGQEVWYYPRRGFDLWNTRYFIVPGRLAWDSPTRGYAAMIPHSTFIYPAPGAFDGPGGVDRRARWGATEDFRILRNDAAYPRAWVVHRAYFVPPVRGLRLADRGKVMQELLYQGDEFWKLPGVAVRDPHGVAWVEADRPKEVEPFLSRAEPDPSEVVTVTRDDPQQVEMTAVLRSPGLVIVSDFHYPGWTVTVDGHPSEILRANRAMRGVALPAGEHRLIFRYRPLSFRFGIVLSSLGLMGAAGLGIWARRGPSRTG